MEWSSNDRRRRYCRRCRRWDEAKEASMAILDFFYFSFFFRLRISSFCSFWCLAKIGVDFFAQKPQQQKELLRLLHCNSAVLRFFCFQTHPQAEGTPQREKGGQEAEVKGWTVPVSCSQWAKAGQGKLAVTKNSLAQTRPMPAVSRTVSHTASGTIQSLTRGT